MIVFLNGVFVAEAEATVSVFDRSFLYGDGLFETMRVSNGRPFRWIQHMQRLERGAEFLGIKIPHTRDVLGEFVDELVVRNQMADGLLRLTLSRGVGKRGYSPGAADKPIFVMTLHPLGTTNSSSTCLTEQARLESGVPRRWTAHTAGFRLPACEPLAQFKTCNKLVQVLARAEAEEAGADEALLLNTDGFIVEAASGNFFWIEHGVVHTPPFASGILAGVTREVVRELCVKLNLSWREANIRPAELARADAAFLSLSSEGIIEVAKIDSIHLGSSPITRQLLQNYLAMVHAECGG